jgi:hypothetical protein
MKMRHAVLAALILAIAGCVPVDSTNPWYLEKQIVFDPAIVGTWVPAEPDKGELRIEKSGPSGYKITMTDVDSQTGKNTTTSYLGLPFQLDNTRYVDVVMAGQKKHWLCKLAVREGMLYMAYLDDDWVKKQIQSGKITLDHSMDNGKEGSSILLTAATAQLQEFVKNLKEEEAFTQGTGLKPKK